MDSEGAAGRSSSDWESRDDAIQILGDRLFSLPQLRDPMPEIGRRFKGVGPNGRMISEPFIIATTEVPEQGGYPRPATAYEQSATAYGFVRNSTASFDMGLELIRQMPQSVRDKLGYSPDMEEALHKVVDPLAEALTAHMQSVEKKVDRRLGHDGYAMSRLVVRLCLEYCQREEYGSREADPREEASKIDVMAFKPNEAEPAEVRAFQVKTGRVSRAEVKRIYNSAKEYVAAQYKTAAKSVGIVAKEFPDDRGKTKKELVEGDIDLELLTWHDILNEAPPRDQALLYSLDC